MLVLTLIILVLTCNTDGYICQISKFKPCIGSGIILRLGVARWADQMDNDEFLEVY